MTCVGEFEDAKSEEEFVRSRKRSHANRLQTVRLQSSSNGKCDTLETLRLFLVLQ